MIIGHTAFDVIIGHIAIRFNTRDDDDDDDDDDDNVAPNKKPLGTIDNDDDIGGPNELPTSIYGIFNPFLMGDSNSSILLLS